MSDDAASWDSTNEFVELDEVAWILGVDRAWVAQASKRADFPDPEIKGLGETLVGAYWRRFDLEMWMRDRGIDPSDYGEDDPWDVQVDVSPAARSYIRDQGRSSIRLASPRQRGMGRSEGLHDGSARGVRSSTSSTPVTSRSFSTGQSIRPTGFASGVDRGRSRALRSGLVSSRTQWLGSEPRGPRNAS